MVDRGEDSVVIDKTDVDGVVFQPTLFPILPPLSRDYESTKMNDAQRLLPQFIENRLGDVDSDEEDTSTNQTLNLNSVSSMTIERLIYSFS